MFVDTGYILCFVLNLESFLMDKKLWNFLQKYGNGVFGHGVVGMVSVVIMKSQVLQ